MSKAKHQQKHLRELDEAYAAVRVVVADPKWCNPHYEPYKKAIDQLSDAIKRIERLNAAEETARDR